MSEAEAPAEKTPVAERVLWGVFWGIMTVNFLALVAWSPWAG